MGTPERSEGFDIYFPHETESRFHCLSSCLPSSFSRCANSLCECLKCRRNTRNLELSDSCQLTLSENLQGMTGVRKARMSLVHLLWQSRLFFLYLHVFHENAKNFPLKFRIPGKLMLFNGVKLNRFIPVDNANNSKPASFFSSESSYLIFKIIFTANFRILAYFFVPLSYVAELSVVVFHDKCETF